MESDPSVCSDTSTYAVNKYFRFKDVERLAAYSISSNTQGISFGLGWEGISARQQVWAQQSITGAQSHMVIEGQRS